jgi:hypothetical protein
MSLAAMYPLLDDSDISRYGIWVRSCAGVCVGLRVRLDTDPQPDPLYWPTALVRAHNSGSCCPPTDPSRGLPRGGICV